MWKTCKVAMSQCIIMDVRMLDFDINTAASRNYVYIQDHQKHGIQRIPSVGHILSTQALVHINMAACEDTQSQCIMGLPTNAPSRLLE